MTPDANFHRAALRSQKIERRAQENGTNVVDYKKQLPNHKPSFKAIAASLFVSTVNQVDDKTKDSTPGDLL